jgi:DNA-binding helix-hairpin-helix protein with protein kinase domain
VVSGFLMPNAEGYKEAFKLYNPRSRQAEFQDVSWRFLIRAASNVARAFAVVHQAGHVIGDVNHSSVMIGPDATAKLIDCDSFQVHFKDESFPCEVGEPLHTAPELQGKSFRGLIRTENHDNFGLAVLIFELLFMGRHPFAGIYEGGDMSLEEKIRTFRFAYGENAAKLGMTQPPGTLPLDSISPELADMFDGAFCPEGADDFGRPGPTYWVEGLDRLESSLAACWRNQTHEYWSGLSACPWCALETSTNVHNFSALFFPSDDQRFFDLSAVWKAISDVKRPLHPDPPQRAVARKMKPSARYEEISSQRWLVRIVAIVFAINAYIAVVRNPDGLGEVAIAALAVAIALAASASLIGRVRMKEARRELDRASERYVRLVARWRDTASSQLFSVELAKLRAKKSAYESLPVLRERALQQNQNPSRERQLQQYLERFVIVPGTLPNLGPERCALLNSKGLLSAADIDQARLKGVSGIEEQLATSLRGWRASIEANFVAIAESGPDQRAMAKVDGELAVRRARLEQDLTFGANHLIHVANSVEAARAELEPRLEMAMHDVSVAHANCQIF